MADQAEKLRSMVGRKAGRVTAILGAKGGVGRTSITTNLSLALSRADYRVCAVDLDFRLSTLSLFFNERPRWNLSHLLEDHLSALEALHPTKHGPLLLGGSHSRTLMELDLPAMKELLKALDILRETFDFILVDTPRELSPQTEAIWNWADDLLLITTPDPPALVGSYALTRRLAGLDTSLLINRCQSKRQEREISDLIFRAGDELLDSSISSYGALPEDYRAYEAICRRQPYLVEFPKSPVSKATQRLAYKFCEQEGRKPAKKGLLSVFNRIV